MISNRPTKGHLEIPPLVQGWVSEHKYATQTLCVHLYSFGEAQVSHFRDDVRFLGLDDVFPTVPEGHKHRVTTPENPRKIPRTPTETPQNPRRDPAEPSERPPQSPLRGKFPRRASRRVVPLGWWPSGTLEGIPPDGFYPYPCSQKNLHLLLQ